VTQDSCARRALGANCQVQSEPEGDSGVLGFRIIPND
jgi:hypothetical protein